MIACHCNRVSAAAIEAAIIDGAVTVDEVTERSQAAGRCGACRLTIEALLRSFEASLSAVEVAA